MDIVLTIIIFLAALFLALCLHELGHFVAARRAGVKVEEFGIGLPPRIFGIRRGETIYSV
ncbi:MAG: site-2 protease family protein, partial [Dehalococcoidia bacterium]